MGTCVEAEGCAGCALAALAVAHHRQGVGVPAAQLVEGAVGS